MPIDYSDIRKLAVAFGKIPEDLRRELRPELRKAGQLVADKAKQNASWSTRIPPAIRVTTSLTSRNGGVSVRVDANKAPHARPYEGVRRNRTFRHPVFGNRDVWVTEGTRPFLFPAVVSEGPEVRTAIAEAVRSATRIYKY